MPHDISVIIPCHNASQYIVEALESVERQILQPKEVILIDDGSSDDSIALAESSGIPTRILYSKYRNAAAARNHGVQNAIGTWLAFLDADDCWLPNHLSNAMGIVDGTNDVAFICPVQRVDDATAYIAPPTVWPLPPSSGLLASNIAQYWVRYGRNWGCTPMVVRRDRFLAVRGFDPQQKIAHDVDMWLRVIHNHTWGYHPEVSVLYRNTSLGSISRTNIAKSSRYAMRSFMKNRFDFPDKYYDRLMLSQIRRALIKTIIAREPIQETYHQCAPFLSVKDKIGVAFLDRFPHLCEKLLGN